ncbi:nucleotidyltransferase domain-containing protein [Clostridium tetani]|uniref:nucleotidyltransferase domain-containing protein n=1 Tax=Clostridium tetani TaxID=1513 RepID=UPI00100B423E|nr:nucleotidyltransferase domain-containing protein [Clostridium tetani]RXM74390.1 nucleotidyltransferase domain-containing protein [Clostridium tetani]
MNFGLRESDLEYIVNVIRGFDEIEKAYIFGSRAKGNYKPGSDIDIAIYGENINSDILSKLNSILEEKSPMPYFFNIVDYSHLKHKELKEHIDRVGKVIFCRK